eukprot:jgi/Mesvir1/26601/Mv09571-RA.1
MVAASTVPANTAAANIGAAGSRPAKTVPANTVALNAAAAGSRPMAPPATAQSATAQSATAQSATAQSAIAQSATAQSATAQSATAQSATAQSATAQSATAQSATAPPSTAQSATAQSATAQSATAQSATAQSATAPPSTAQSATAPPTTAPPPTAAPPAAAVPAPVTGRYAAQPPVMRRYFPGRPAVRPRLTAPVAPQQGPGWAQAGSRVAPGWNPRSSGDSDGASSDSKDRSRNEGGTEDQGGKGNSINLMVNQDTNEEDNVKNDEGGDAKGRDMRGGGTQGVSRPVSGTRRLYSAEAPPASLDDILAVLYMAGEGAALSSSGPPSPAPGYSARVTDASGPELLQSVRSLLCARLEQSQLRATWALVVQQARISYLEVVREGSHDAIITTVEMGLSVPSRNLLSVVEGGKHKRNVDHAMNQLLVEIQDHHSHQWQCRTTWMVDP